MKWIREIMRGMVVGVAGILPGVSGGAMLVAMGVYDVVIGCVNALISDFRHSMQVLWPYVLGMLLGALLLARLIALSLDRFPLQTYMAFIGLILGGLPAMVKRVKRVKRGIAGGIAFLVMFALSVGFPLLNPRAGADVVLGYEIDQVLALLGIGIIASSTMVIPGVSGSMILMMLGYYNPIVSAISRMTDALICWKPAILLYHGLLLMPFALGVAMGTLAVARMVEILLKRFEGPACCAMLGLIVASPIVSLLGLELSNATALSWLVGAELGIWGFAIAFELSRA